MSFLPPSLGGKAINRKGRTQKRSRQGCSNCKIRCVKCDESKPQCRRCTDYDVVCTYVQGQSDIRFSGEKAVNFLLIRSLPYIPNETEVLLKKFQLRTVLTVSAGRSTSIYQNEIVQLATSIPYLKHTILTLTLMHDRFLDSPLDAQLSPAEAYHWSQAAGSFYKRLSRPTIIGEKASLWVTAAFLVTISYCYIDARSPYEAWPLRPPSSSDLNWLKMNTGKREVGKSYQSSDFDPIYEALVASHMNNMAPISPINLTRLQGCLPGFASLYGLDASPGADDIYKKEATHFAQTYEVDDPIQAILGFLFFAGTMTPKFKQLLERKEPRALLLLACWHAKMYQLPMWWLWRRSLIEGQAICIYLEQYHGHEGNIQIPLSYPKSIISSTATLN